MYPDPITPRSHPHLLSKVDYDPFKVMPAEMPPAPRVFATAAQIERARARVAEGVPVDVHCLEQLLKACKLEESLPELQPQGINPDWGGPLMPYLHSALYNALAWHMTDNEQHRTRALEALRLAARACPHYRWTGHEHNEAESAARAYDLLAASGLSPADDNAFRDMLWLILGGLNHGEHRSCNNHNSMNLAGRLAIGAALGHFQIIHDTWYGFEHEGLWRYGLIHILRHDFLADGMHWEGTLGYHMVVLRNVCELLSIQANLGVDLWQREWPSTVQDDSIDEHRGWGPKGLKPPTAMFDALIYQAYVNGDYTLLHDEVYGNLRDTWAWFKILNKAYDVYGESRYAWAVQHTNRGHLATKDGPVPAWFEGGNGALDFVRLETRDYPIGENPFPIDRQISLSGQHVNGCTLFPVHGAAVLRTSTTDETSPGARLYYGPHWAGHRSPAALHLDIHAHGRRLSVAPHLAGVGYEDPRHLTWVRTTISHNTVTLDGEPMFPYDFPSDSLWECDQWRDTISDGVLVQFEANDQFKVARASNDNVYTGAKLDRTVILTGDYLLDVFRVTADSPRQIDWAMHCHGIDNSFSKCDPVDLGEKRGYRHMTDARLHPQTQGWVSLPVGAVDRSQANLWLDGAPGAQLIIAHDTPVDNRRPIGDAFPPQPRTALILRTHASAALFVSLWSFDGDSTPTPAVESTAEGDIEIYVGSQLWRLPVAGPVGLA